MQPTSGGEATLTLGFGPLLDVNTAKKRGGTASAYNPIVPSLQLRIRHSLTSASHQLTAARHEPVIQANNTLETEALTE